MAMYFEQGTLPNGEKGDMFVVERGVSDKAVFPADALTPDGRTTYREQYAAQYDVYKNGDGANADLANSPGAFPGQPSGAPPARDEPAKAASTPAPAPVRSEPETVRPPASDTNAGQAKSNTDKTTASKL
jgi:hypothetical protein